jgi:hypothetical protein
LKRITDSAEGKDCQIRLVGICNHDPSTVVFCHFRIGGISGIGYKTDAPIGAYGCSACHAVVDRTKDPEIQLDFAKGCLRTLEIMWRTGVIR